MATTKPRYAAGTTVGKYKSLEQIETTVKKYGGTSFTHGETEYGAAIVFECLGSDGGKRRIRFSVTYPMLEEITATLGKGNQYTQGKSVGERAESHRQAEILRLFRSLALGIKGRLELVESKIETMEESFYAHIVTPSGLTIFEESHEAIATAYQTGQMPPLLPSVRLIRARHDEEGNQ